MARSSQYDYAGIDKPILPYRSYTSPVDTSPHYCAGSQNIMASSIGYIEKRPGFADIVLSIPNSETIDRIFTWERWDGEFFMLICAIDFVAKASIVYAAQPNQVPAAIFVQYGSLTPFDFIVSNNKVYFGNGEVGSMQKYDGSVVTKWGVDAPTIAPTFTFQPTMNGAVTANIVSGGIPSYSISNAGQNYNPSDPPMLTITGDGTGATAYAQVGAGILTNPVITSAGMPPSDQVFDFGVYGAGGYGGVLTITYSGGIMTSVVIKSPGSGYNFDHLNVALPYGAAFTIHTDHPYGIIYGVQATSPGSGYTTATVSVDPSGISAFTSYYWGYTYVTRYGHESNMSPLSNASGIFTNSAVQVTVQASSDLGQVIAINLYRTTDGGSQSPDEMQLVSTSESGGGPSLFIDATADIDLQLQDGPPLLRNSLPTPCMGFVYWNNRIFGFKDGTVYFSGAEEIANGVPEEAWPSGLDGDYQTWPQKVQGLGVTPDILATALAGQFWQTAGDTLDTFRISPLLDKRGVRCVTGIASAGNVVIWWDKSNQIWMSDGGEIGMPIRADLAKADPSQVFVGMHVQNNFHWIYAFDRVNGFLYIYDLDLQQWYPPWTVPFSTAIWSGEMSPGVTKLYIAYSNGLVCSLEVGQYLDGGLEYGEFAQLSLIDIAVGGDETNRNRDGVGIVEQFEIETNMYTPTQILQINDDIPSPTTPTLDITNYRQPPSFREQGNQLFSFAYRSAAQGKTAERAAFSLEWAVSQNPWKLYSMDCAFRKSAQ